jgi:hypothetical protein
VTTRKKFADGRGAGLTVAALAAFIAATLQAAGADPLPSYAAPDGTIQIQGSVSSISGRDLTLRDERGFLDHVVLRDGTVINPTGMEIASGQALTIHGHTDGNVFDASEIDAAAGSYASAPIAVDPYVPYFDPYYGYGYGYGYAPYFGTSVFFGFGDRFGGRGFGGRGFGERGFSGAGFSGHGGLGRGGGRGR